MGAAAVRSNSSHGLVVFQFESYCLMAPPSRRGRRADQTNATLPQNRRGGGGQTTVSDLPGCALLKVARHSLCRAQPPLLEGGVDRTIILKLNN